MYSIKMRSSNQDVHISGAETICEFDKIEQTVQRFYNKGFFHENGQPDFLNIKIQKNYGTDSTNKSITNY